MKNIAIFASGSGTNAENIVRIFHKGDRLRVAIVLTNKHDAGVHARMEALGVPTAFFPNNVWASEPEKIIEALRPYDIDLVVLAGFMRRIAPEIIEAFPNSIINIHPALLPAYGGKGMYGHHVHEAVIAAGEKKSGVTVHYVNNDIDGGEIIMQQEVEILPDDTAETLEAKIHPVEYELYPRAIAEVIRRMDKPLTVDEAWAETLHLPYSEEQTQNSAPESAVASPTPIPTPPPTPQNSTPQPTDNPTKQTADNTPKPPAYLWLSILMAILFSTSAGIVAIVFSSITKSRNAKGNFEAARTSSRVAQIFIIISFVLGILTYTVWYPISMVTNLLWN